MGITSKSIGMVKAVKKKEGPMPIHPRGRLNHPMRYVIGRWNVRHWLARLQQNCEWKRVSFRSVSARNTSRTCSSCGHVDKRNRSIEKFLCLKCGYVDDADVNAAKNIFDRFLAGAYGPGLKLPLGHICLQRGERFGDIAV